MNLSADLPINHTTLLDLARSNPDLTKEATLLSKDSDALKLLCEKLNSYRISHSILCSNPAGIIGDALFQIQDYLDSTTPEFRALFPSFSDRNDCSVFEFPPSPLEGSEFAYQLDQLAMQPIEIHGNHLTLDPTTDTYYFLQAEGAPTIIYVNSPIETGQNFQAVNLNRGIIGFGDTIIEALQSLAEMQRYEEASGNRRTNEPARWSRNSMLGILAAQQSNEFTSPSQVVRVLLEIKT